MELFKVLTGTDLVHVPYKGTAPAITELVGGQVQVMLTAMPSVLPFVKSGKLRILAVAATRRSRAIPEVPTAIEAGVPGFECGTWNGMFAPAKTPKAVIDKLHAQVVKVLAEPEVARRLAGQGTEPGSSTPAALSRIMVGETERWRKVIRTAGIRVE